MAKDVPSWQRTEPMTIEEARQRTLNYIRNSTSCCYAGDRNVDPYTSTPCIHTPEWIESEAQKRLDHANQYLGWTNRLGDLMSGVSAVKAGRILADSGLRDEKGQPSDKALAGDAPLAVWAEHHGYPVAIWSVERVREYVASIQAAA